MIEIHASAYFDNPPAIESDFESANARVELALRFSTNPHQAFLQLVELFDDIPRQDYEVLRALLAAPRQMRK